VTLTFDLKNIKLIGVKPLTRPISIWNKKALWLIVLKIMSRNHCDGRRAASVVREPFYLNIFSSETAHSILTKLHRNDPWVVPCQSCISRSQGQKIGFQNAIFKNILVWNYKAQSFHIWYIASSRGPLPKLFKLCRWGQNWPRPGDNNFTLNYIRKSSNNISWTTNGNMTKLHRNNP